MTAPALDGVWQRCDCCRRPFPTRRLAYDQCARCLLGTIWETVRTALAAAAGRSRL